MNVWELSRRHVIRVIAGTFLALAVLAAMAPAAFAQGQVEIMAVDGTDEVAETIGDIALAVVRLLLGAGGAIFVVSIARGAFDGVLASVIGLPGEASVGLLRVAGVLGAFMLLLVSFGASRAFVELLADQFINRGALAVPAPGNMEVYVPAGGQGLQALADVIGEVLRIVLFLIGAWFLVNTLLVLINGEIGLATGSPGALARLVERLATSLVLLVIGASTPSLTRELARAIEGAGMVTSAGGAFQVYGAAFTIVVDILLALFVGVFIVVVVGSGFVAQAGMALGLPRGLGTGVARVVTAFAIALIGFGIIGFANQVLFSLLG